MTLVNDILDYNFRQQRRFDNFVKGCLVISLYLMEDVADKEFFHIFEIKKSYNHEIPFYLINDCLPVYNQL